MSQMKSIILVILMLVSISSGCLGNSDEIDQKNDTITNLENEIINLNQENDNLSNQIESMNENLALIDNISSELEGLLFSANSTLESLHINLETNEQTINLLSEQRDNLQIELQQVIDSNSTVISELEANITQLNQQINDLETDSLSLNSQIVDAQEEISELTNTIVALNDQISKLTYQMFTDTQGCPYSAPSEKMKIGWDLNSDNQLLGNEEIQMISGDCMAGIGKVAPVDDNGNERIAQMVEMGGVLYFTADDGIHGSELWRSDGTVGGTYMVIDLTPRMCPTCANMDTDISELVAGDSKLFFASPVQTAGVPDLIKELFVSDGTEAGTTLVKDIFDCPTNTGEVMIDYSGINSLMVIPGSSIGPSGQDKVVFSAFDCSTAAWTCYGEEPWISDGTEAGTMQVDNLRVGDTPMSTPDGFGVVIDAVGSQPRNFFQDGNQIYFTADDNVTGREIWNFNFLQLSNGAHLIKDINQGAADSFLFDSDIEFIELEGDILFAANNGIVGNELWKTDGSIEGTTLLKNIAINESSSNPSQFTLVGGDTVFFTANDAIHGTELWKTNGSWAGTEMVEDILQGSEGSNPNYLTEFNGAIYFSAESDDTSGQVAMMANYEHLTWEYTMQDTVQTLENGFSSNYILITSKPIVTENGLYFIGTSQHTNSDGLLVTMSVLHHYHWEANAMLMDEIIWGEGSFENAIGGLLGSLDNTLYFKMKGSNDFSYYKSPLDVYTMTVDN